MQVDKWSVLMEQMKRGTDNKQLQRGEKKKQDKAFEKRFSSCGLERRWKTRWIHFARLYFKALVILMCDTDQLCFDPKVPGPAPPGQLLVSKPILQDAACIFIFKSKMPGRPVIRSSISLCNETSLC